MKSGVLFFKIIAHAGAVLVAFPMIVFAQIFDYQDFVPLRAINYLSAGVAALIVGMVLSKIVSLIENNKHRHICRFIANLLAFASGLIVLPIRNAFSFQLGETELFILLATISYCCFIGLRNGQKPFTDIFTIPMLGCFSAFSIAMMLFFTAFVPELKSAQSALVYVFIIEYTIASILLNQSNIEKQANRRRDINALVPKNLRIYNISLIIPVAILFSLGYAFRSHIVTLINLIVKAISWLITRLLEAVLDVGDNIPAELPEAQQDMPFEEQSLGILGIILFIIQTIIVLFILFRIRWLLWDMLKSTIRWFISLFTPKPHETGIQAAFTDYFEDVVYEKKEKPQAALSLKDLIKQYQKEKRPIVKIRLSYRIFMMWLIKKGADITPSDTVQTHIDNLENPDDFTEYADLYSSVRYGDDTGEDNIKLADTIVNGCMN
ncbi:MAG: hypothetical protein FWD34_10510 [Oscillospiraceae bacterium]|nr:hypothetical protein [Oscillospiraceae bacterium]